MSIILVSDAAGLNAAAQAALAGDTILLAAGTYSGVSISNALKDGTVNIQSADISHQAILTDMKITGSSGFSFSNLEFSATVGTDLTISFKVIGSQNIHFDHLNVHGTMDGDPTTDMSGISISQSSNVSITNSEFQQLKNAIADGCNDNVQFTGNYFHDIRSDGIDSTGSSNVLISNNYFTNFRHVTGDHSDAIQFFTANRTESVHDITVTNNVINQGTGVVMQGIFMQDEVGTLPYIDVKISGNAIIGGNWNGIYNNHSQGLEITDNMLVSLTGQQTPWVRVSKADGGTINNNDAAVFCIDAATVTNVTQYGNDVTIAVSDSGLAALHDWLVAHPDNSAPLPASLLIEMGLAPAEITTITLTTLSSPPPPEPDAVSSSVSYTLGAASHSLTLTGSGNIDGTGNGLGNTITGNVGANHLTGGAGADTIVDGGGAGADTMAGKAGDDTYYVNNTADLLIEDMSAGKDTVFASVTYTLGPNIESLVLTGSANIDGTGNDLGNTITGNVGTNHLTGGAGADTISDGGGAGADAMAGKGGNDTYFVNNAADVVLEKAGEGTDTVNASVSWTLGANVENLVLTGTANIDGTGNNLGDRITGNSGLNHLTGGSGADSLDGGAGADTMLGGGGNDTYVVGAGDLVQEKASQGVDLVQASVTYSLTNYVENLALTGTANIAGTGNTLANSLMGNSGANRLAGGDGADSINGGAGNDSIVGNSGNDVLTGGTGDDIFTFARGGNHDVIWDFKANGDHDQLDISNLSSHRYQPIIADHGTYTTVSFSTGDSVDLMGVHAADLHLDHGFIL